MLKNSFFKTIPFLLFIVLFNSCDKEFNVVGEDIIGDNSFDIQKSEYPVVAYNQKLGPIQSNNLDINPLGVYNNPSFGTTNANFVTQVTLATVDPDFDTSATIKSVVLTVPYFTDKNKTVVNTDGSSTYVLDSIYGPDKAKMKLSVYESGYFMRDLDPEDQFSQPQKYYNNQYSDFNQLKMGTPLNNGSNSAENSAFFFDPAEHVVKTTTDGKETITRTPPRMELNLNKDFFLAKIIKAPAGSLTDNNAFRNYFRGLFFNIETIGGNPGNMAMLNFKSGEITITYTETVNSVATEKTFILKLSGNTVSLLDQSNTNVNYANATDPANVNSSKGDSNLYLKGGEGSLSILKLFGEDKYGVDGVSGTPNGVADQLDIMRKNKYLINEANLVFHLNSTAMGSSYVPQRIYLYDFKNNQILIDYIESTTVVSNTKNNKFVFGGILNKKSDVEGGSYYKFRITNHIRNLVKYADSTNVDLGLVVTEDINKSNFYALRDKTGKAPMASVMNPLGTIVFGNNIPTDDKDYNKRLKFEIYYTKPN
jgi:hypothetical protein